MVHVNLIASDAGRSGASLQESAFSQPYGPFKQHDISEPIIFFIWCIEQFFFDLTVDIRDETGPPLPGVTLPDALFLSQFKIHQSELLTQCGSRV